MKSKALINSAKLGAVALTLSILPTALPARATTTTTDPVAPGAADTAVVTTEDDGFDWGWLGLLGLIGLAGLAGRRSEPARYSEPDVTTRTTNRY